MTGIIATKKAIFYLPEVCPENMEGFLDIPPTSYRGINAANPILYPYCPVNSLSRQDQGAKSIFSSVAYLAFKKFLKFEKKSPFRNSTTLSREI